MPTGARGDVFGAHRGWVVLLRWVVVTFLVRLAGTVTGMSMCCPVSRRPPYPPVPGGWWA